METFKIKEVIEDGLERLRFYQYDEFVDDNNNSITIEDIEVKYPQPTLYLETSSISEIKAKAKVKQQYLTDGVPRGRIVVEGAKGLWDLLNELHSPEKETKTETTNIRNNKMNIELTGEVLDSLDGTELDKMSYAESGLADLIVDKGEGYWKDKVFYLGQPKKVRKTVYAVIAIELEINEDDDPIEEFSEITWHFEDSEANAKIMGDRLIDASTECPNV